MTADERHVTTFTTTTARALAPTFRPVFARILASVEVRDGSR
jgi:hypothetical protein